jgi:3-isopropylmalate/(R)-2-methylmalate dehydratase large subunit
MGKTIAEKILSAKSGQDAQANDIVVADLDFVMGQDGTSGLAIQAFEAMQAQHVFDPSRGFRFAPADAGFCGRAED